MTHLTKFTKAGGLDIATYFLYFYINLHATTGFMSKIGTVYFLNHIFIFKYILKAFHWSPFLYSNCIFSNLSTVNDKWCPLDEKLETTI